jgi:pimeloyl-ACP methyl ester carboxylesterase
MVRSLAVTIAFSSTITAFSATVCAGAFFGTSGSEHDHTPVLFVHGRGLSADSFSGMIRYLEASGYPPSFLRAINLYPKDAPNVEKFLENVNDEIRRGGGQTTAKTKVDIVAHSMGSMSSRWYTAKIRPDRVRAWISLAGPNHGSDANCPGLPGSGKREQCPAYATSSAQSQLQYQLNGGPDHDVDETPYGLGTDASGVKRILPDDQRRIAYFTIRTNNDKFISPIDSTIIDGAGGMPLTLPRSVPATETTPGNFLMENNVGHDEMTWNPAVYQLVRHILQTADKEMR